jgi:hypothetical protein
VTSRRKLAIESSRKVYVIRANLNPIKKKRDLIWPNPFFKLADSSASGVPSFTSSIDVRNNSDTFTTAQPAAGTAFSATETTPLGEKWQEQYPKKQEVLTMILEQFLDKGELIQ